MASGLVGSLSFLSTCRTGSRWPGSFLFAAARVIGEGLTSSSEEESSSSILTGCGSLLAEPDADAVTVPAVGMIETP
jgi:hypothetical protein